MQKKKLVIVIPSYNPNERLVELVNSLEQFFDKFNLIIVDDGSTTGLEHFKTCKKSKSTTILKHEVNKGKGQALKTAYEYIKHKFKSFVVITADSDGQHKPEDIKKVYDFYMKNQGSFILGSRKFDCEVPKKSTAGNRISKDLLRVVLNKYLHDTQTGLRAFGDELLDFMLEIPGSRYEYEMNVLNETARNDIPVKEIAIQTVYFENNKSSHFRPIRDFSKIALSLLKYTLPLLVSFFLTVPVLMVISSHNFLINAGVSAALCVIIFLYISLNGFMYGNKNILKNRTKLKRSLIYGLIWLAVLGLGTLILKNFVPALILADILEFVIIALLNYWWISKDIMFTTQDL